MITCHYEDKFQTPESSFKLWKCLNQIGSKIKFVICLKIQFQAWIIFDQDTVL